MMTKEKIHIAACFDHGFVMPTGVMIFSVCVNNPDVNIDFHLVVDESVTVGDRTDLTETVSAFDGMRVLFYDVNSQQCTRFPLHMLPSSTYYRLFLSEILPETIDKVLYLDGDCVVRHTLLPLWKTSLEGYALGAAVEATESIAFVYERLRYPSEYGYFNAGVLLINLVFWRQQNVVSTFVSFIETHTEAIRWDDQDVLNAVFYDKKIAIPIEYNLHTGCLLEKPRWKSWDCKDDVIKVIKDPVIVHFTFRNKPWETYARYPHPFTNSFLKYQNQTKWKRCRIEKRSRKTILRNFIGDCFRKVGLISLGRSPYVEVQCDDA